MHPHEGVAALMKFSFDAEHRQAMCTLGGLHAIAELIQVRQIYLLFLRLIFSS